jgi:hypothetical protein
MNGFDRLLEVDTTLEKLLFEINKNAKETFLSKNQINYSLNYLKYNVINNNYNETHMKNYILTSLINCLSIPTINFTDNGQYFYIYLTDIKDPEDKNIIIIKIGFTTNLENRYDSLKKTYKCNLYLIGFRKINGIFDEQKFHKHIKKSNNELFIPLKKSKKLNSFTDETYFLHPIIMAEAVDYIVNLPNQLEIQQEITKQISIQEETKKIQIKEQEKTKQMQEKTKQMEEKNKQMQLKIELLKLKKK